MNNLDEVFQKILYKIDSIQTKSNLRTLISEELYKTYYSHLEEEKNGLSATDYIHWNNETDSIYNKILELTGVEL